ncbi:MAG: sugar phosphate isomerase/epimerase [Lentisphaerae bacterium]|nr:sugar phosphate isomerase/epimerase [Lentisphaerota bacterium]
MLSMTTDYSGMTHWSPEPYLKRIAEAGFSHVHWCHQWNTDFVYAKPEIAQIDRWLKQYGLKLLDLHASHGVEKKYMSVFEYERLAGVELVKNRLDMTARLGGGVIILHITYSPAQDRHEDLSMEQLRRSLDTLEPYARKRRVRIAIENGTFPRIVELFADYGPGFLGLCYDSGHGNALGGGSGLDHLDRWKERLISLHLHDNDGTADQHKPPFTGTVDWPRLARIIAFSSYDQCVSMESNMNVYPLKDEAAFLALCFENGMRFQRMIEQERAGRTRA